MAVSDDDRRSPISALRFSTNRYPGFGLRNVRGYSSSISTPASTPSVSSAKGGNPLLKIRAEEQSHGEDSEKPSNRSYRGSSVMDPADGLQGIMDVGYGWKALGSAAGKVAGLPIGMGVSAVQGFNNIGAVNQSRKAAGLDNMGAWDTIKSGVSANEAKEQIESIVDNDARDGGSPSYGATGDGPLGGYSKASVSNAMDQSDAQAAENDAQYGNDGGSVNFGSSSGGNTGADVHGDGGAFDHDGSDNDSQGGGGGDSSGDCFITTATVDHMGMVDNAPVLETLRWFRDNVLAKTEEGRAKIVEYYETAPTIVDRLNQRVDAEAVYRDLFKRFISPAATAVTDGKYEQAEQIYTDMVMDLQEKE